MYHVQQKINFSAASLKFSFPKTEWCRDGQFVCGNSRFCVDQSNVCDGVRDCPHGEDEKKCAALIDDEHLQPSQQTYQEFFAKDDEHIFQDHLTSIDRKDTDVDETGNLTDVVSGREISSSKLRNSLVRAGSSIRADVKANGPLVRFSNRLEVNNYNDRGYLNVRKNGKWGKLCLDDTDNLLQQRQLSWTIEDLGRAVCKAITYQ